MIDKQENTWLFGSEVNHALIFNMDQSDEAAHAGSNLWKYLVFLRGFLRICPL